MQVGFDANTIAVPGASADSRAYLSSEVDWHPETRASCWGYLQFLGLMARARVVFTDSGGVQEETTILGVPARDHTAQYGAPDYY